MQNKYIEYNYRGVILHLDKNEYDSYRRKRGYFLSDTSIDQFIYNESDKSIDDEIELMKHYTASKIEEIVNDYLRIENNIWK